MLQKLIALKTPLSLLRRGVGGEVEKGVYTLKLQTILNSIYGCDIQPMAVELSRLRCWLSLIIDEPVDKKKENWGIENLPNLDFKFVCVNTLIGLPKMVEDSLGTSAEDFEKLIQLRTEFFTASAKRKIKIEQEFKALQNHIAEKQREWSTKNTEAVTMLINWNPFKVDETAWFDPFWMFGVNEGFDIAIGNPPYGASYPEKDKKHFKQYYVSAQTKNGLKGSLDTFSLFIEKSFVTLSNNSFLTFIVPLAVTSSDSLSSLHNLLLKNCEKIAVSTYSNRPKKIFDNADQRVAILFFHKNNQPIKYLLTTKVNKRYEDTSIEDLISSLSFVNSIGFIQFGRLPKVGNEIELSILKKIFSIKSIIKNLLLNDGEQIYYRTSGGRYYNIITNFSTGSSKESFITVNKEIRDVLAAVLSSNLYYWFYHIYSNTLDLKTYELEIFPVPIERLLDKKEKIERLYMEYLNDLYKNSKIKNVNYAHTKEYREYYARKSKHIIDKIDLEIKNTYGFTDEEVNFIINYDLKFRTDDE